MVNKVHYRGKVRLEYRSEQIILAAQLKATWGEIVQSEGLEAVVEVFHPEVAPKKYGTTVDLYYRLKGGLSICIDLHGSWHEKNKVQVRDENKRLALEYCGHHYIEIRNYIGAEECPALWEVVNDAKKMSEAKKHDVQQAWQYQSHQHMMTAMKEVSQQLTIQLANSRPRQIEPSTVVF